MLHNDVDRKNPDPEDSSLPTALQAIKEKKEKEKERKKDRHHATRFPG